MARLSEHQEFLKMILRVVHDMQENGQVDELVACIVVQCASRYSKVLTELEASNKQLKQAIVLLEKTERARQHLLEELHLEQKGRLDESQEYWEHSHQAECEAGGLWAVNEALIKEAEKCPCVDAHPVGRSSLARSRIYADEYNKRDIPF